MRLRNVALGLGLTLACGFAPASFAAAPAPTTITFTLRDHRFTPATVNVRAGERVQIDLINQDMATEEFDSHDLQVEQLVTPHGRVRFTIGPLRPGRYAFMGEFHPETAQGVVIVAAPLR